MKSVILLFVIGLAASVNLKHVLKLSDEATKQLHGLRKLLHKSENIFATCKIVLFKKMVDFETADNHCKGFDIQYSEQQAGNLATINDDEKNMHLALLLAEAYPKPTGKWTADGWVWAGLRKIKNNTGKRENKKFEEEYRVGDWEWANGENPNTYHRWMKAQPDQQSVRYGKVQQMIKCTEKPTCLQHQMRINHKGQWDDTFKFMKHPYACDYQGKYILSTTLSVWSVAKSICEDAGLIMAKIRNKEEVEEMIAEAKYFLEPRVAETWNNTNWIWIGGTDEDENGSWKWTDGKPVVAGGSEWTTSKEMPWIKQGHNQNPDNAAFVANHNQTALAFSKWGEFDDSYDHSYYRHRPFACQCPGS